MRYVQHKSGQGEKWPVTKEYTNIYQCEWPSHPYNKEASICLPKSEYIPCDPPETWRDVTADSSYNDSEPGRASITHYGPFNRVCVIDTGYRLRKLLFTNAGMPREGFIVERKDDHP